MPAPNTFTARANDLGRARVEDAHHQRDLVRQLAEPDVHRIVERLFFIQIVSFDWNCPKYITPRYTPDEVEKIVAPLKARIAELEAQLKSKHETGIKPRPPLPPFTEETARQKVPAGEDAWNTRDPERVALAYTDDTP